MELPDGAGPAQDDPAAEAPDASPADVTGSARRRLLDEVFGDVLPETTSDERDAGSGGGAYTEQWYRENRPPHHG